MPLEQRRLRTWGPWEHAWGKIAEKGYTPPTLLKIKVYDPEPRLKVHIPVFQPPGHCIDGLGLY